MSLLLHRPWEKYLNPFLKCPPFIPTTAFWIVCFNKWGDMTLWVWDRKRGWWFLKPLDLGGILHSPHSWKEGYFWLFLSGHNPELRSICSCPSRLATSMLKLVVRVAVIHSRADHYELRSGRLKGDEKSVMSHLIGCFESWTSRWRERESPGEV